VSDGNQTITAVRGIRVGHATPPEGGTGCTVVLGPFRAAVQVTGMATGSRELHVLDVEHLVPAVDAILLTGGSAFGLAAVDGVAAWMLERDIGYQTGSGHRVPIVPAGVVFDLAAGRPRPNPATGRAACEAASDGPVAEGRVGAGTSATVGKLAGHGSAMPGGVGSWALGWGGWRVGALAVVNAIGDVLDAAGRIVAGARDPAGGFRDCSRLLRESTRESVFRAGIRAAEATTLAVVATDAPLGRVDLLRLARMAAAAFPRRISPVNTPFDGDMVFAVSPAPEVAQVTSGELLALGVAARDALEESITRAVS
jgi:L-aminopeptidase/D-esterase-like protein